MKPEILKFWKYVPTKKPIYAGKFCSVPYTTLSVDDDGDVHLCICAAHMPYIIGNIYKQTLQEIWLGDEANKVRQAVDDGDFTYCNWDCNRLEHLPDTPKTLPELSKFPTIFKIDMDKSCNLKCPSCRENVIIEKHADKILQQTKIFEEIINWGLENPQTTMTVIPVGSGEIFASHSGLNFLHALENYPHNNIKLHLTSNGTLIKKNQDLIFKLKNFITDWSISIDAATPETYALVRGGNWNDLLEGLEIVQEFNIKPALRFCIQQKNYHEIEAFAEFAQKYGGKFGFQKLSDWGHWTIQWWRDSNVFDRTKPSFNEALQSLINVENKYQHTLPGELVRDIKKFKDTLRTVT
jgi:radical SAM protein with 4Fe4S-binding SPASM domain